MDAGSRCGWKQNEETAVCASYTQAQVLLKAGPGTNRSGIWSIMLLSSGRDKEAATWHAPGVWGS